jgi:hypothetical protein
MKGLSNFIAIKNFHTRYLGADNIKDDHSLGGAEFYVAMIGAVGSLRTWFAVKRRTKVIPTTAAINDGQGAYLRCQGWLGCFDEQSLQFLGQFGQRFDEEEGHGNSLGDHRINLIQILCVLCPQLVK